MDLYTRHPVRHRDIRDALLFSIALEELALAHVLNAEAEKAQSLAKGRVGRSTPDEIIEFQRSLAAVLQSVIKKEEVLLKKLRIVLDVPREEPEEE